MLTFCMCLALGAGSGYLGYWIGFRRATAVFEQAAERVRKRENPTGTSKRGMTLKRIHISR